MSVGMPPLTTQIKTTAGASTAILHMAITVTARVMAMDRAIMATQHLQEGKGDLMTTRTTGICGDNPSTQASCLKRALHQ